MKNRTNYKSRQEKGERDEVVSFNCNSCNRAIEKDVEKERKSKERKQPDLTLYT